VSVSGKITPLPRTREPLRINWSLTNTVVSAEDIRCIKKLKNNCSELRVQGSEINLIIK
jgi:hypothetical protein